MRARASLLFAFVGACASLQGTREAPLEPTPERVGAAAEVGATADDGAPRVPPSHSGTFEDRAAALAWLGGAWRTTPDPGLETEEHWTAPRGGTLFGVARTLREDRTVAFEYMRIEDRDGVLTFVASPSGATASVDFRLVSAGEARVVFENPEHDFPQRIIYWREGRQLHARIEDLAGTRSMSWRFDPL